MRESEIIALFPVAPQSDQAANCKSESSGPPAFARDDCGQIDARTIVTTDSLSEGTHFRLDWSTPEDLAIKLWQVNASDLASSGGTAEWCLLNLGLPTDLSDAWLRAFAAALRDELNTASVRLIGGDTYRAQTMQLTLTLGGSLSGDSNTGGTPVWLRRDGARAGDAIFVTGTPGLSKLGYELLSGERERPATPDPLVQAALDRHLRPRARGQAARLLGQTPDLRPTALLDLSDGLYLDLSRLAAANPRLSFELNYAALPLFPVPPDSALSIDVDERRFLALTSGEELELLFTAPPERASAYAAAGMDCTAIGRVRPRAGTPQDSGLRLVGAPWPRPPQPGFEHF